MNILHLFPTLTLPFIITIFFSLMVVPVSRCDDDEDHFSNCSSPYPYRCGSREFNISYPFWGGNRPRYCGRQGFEIKCHDNENDEYHFIEFETPKFRVLSINDSHSTVTIARDDLWKDYCPGIVTNHTVFNLSLFKLSPNIREVSFFHKCNGEMSPGSPNYFKCTLPTSEEVTVFMVDQLNHQLRNLTNTCLAEIKVPVLSTALHDPLNLTNLQEVLNKGFEVEYIADNTFCSHCNSSGGICGSNPSAPDQFSCFCRDHDEPQRLNCPSPPPPSPGMFMFLAYNVSYVCFKGNSSLLDMYHNSSLPSSCYCFNQTLDLF